MEGKDTLFFNLSTNLLKIDNASPFDFSFYLGARAGCFGLRCATVFSAGKRPKRTKPCVSLAQTQSLDSLLKVNWLQKNL
jgi:hypothetical protein